MKPTPVNKQVVCSVCGLDWARHGKSPGVEKCVELLKADLAALRTNVQPLPLPVSPYPAPRNPYAPYPWRPTYPGITYGNVTTGIQPIRFNG